MCLNFFPLINPCQTAETFTVELLNRPLVRERICDRNCPTSTGRQRPPSDGCKHLREPRPLPLVQSKYTPDIDCVIKYLYTPRGGPLLSLTPYKIHGESRSL